MARVTVEDCIKNVNNRFMLVQAAVKRTRQIMEGSKPLVQAKNRAAVVALREIAQSKVVASIDNSKIPIQDPHIEETEEEVFLGAEIKEVAVDEMKAAQPEEATDVEEEVENEEIEEEPDEDEDINDEIDEDDFDDFNEPDDDDLDDRDDEDEDYDDDDDLED